MIKKIGIICLTLLLGSGFALLPRLTLAQSPAFLESRIARVETEMFQLRSQLNRIQSQIAGSDRSLNQRSRSERLTPQIPPGTNRRQVLSSDPMFDKLATLVVELNQRVKALEAQVAQLKKQRQ